jgi:C_GCAxxG_C_C family probable redox protein
MKLEPAMTNPSEIAVARFHQDFNCSQSVFVAFAPQLGLDESQALKLASPFGGGVARRAQTCGAVTGALMALGLARGADTPAGKEDAYRLGQEFLQRFESLHATILCRELLGCDISTPEGRQKAREQGAFTALCPLFVRDAAEIAGAMLAEKQ